MSETSTLRVIRLWAALAWADGVLADAERQGLERLIANSPLEPEERVAATGFLAGPVELDRTGLDELTPDARKGIYRSACRLARIDGTVANAERAFLGKLRVALAMPEAVAQDLETAAGL